MPQPAASEPRLPALVIITDWSIDDLLERIDDALAAGPRIAVQHRGPQLTGRALYELGLKLLQVCRRHGAWLFINGRLDVALALNAHLHLPASGMPVSLARQHLPPASLLSVAVHDEREAATAAGADFALVSPVFSPHSKPHDTRQPLGKAGFTALARTLACPAFALGGIDSEHLVAGAAGLACISGVLQASSPRAAAKALLAAL